MSAGMCWSAVLQSATPQLSNNSLTPPPSCGTGDYVKTKRALIRAVEKQAEMSEKMDLLKAELEALDRNGGGGGGGGGDHSSAVSTSAHSGGFGAGGFGAGATWNDVVRLDRSLLPV